MNPRPDIAPGQLWYLKVIEGEFEYVVHVLGRGEAYDSWLLAYTTAEGRVRTIEMSNLEAYVEQGEMEMTRVQ